MRATFAAVAVLALLGAAYGAQLRQGRTLVSSRAAAPHGWRLVGAATGAERMRLRFALKQHNLANLEALFWRVSDPRDEAYGQFLAPEAIASLVHNPRAEAAVRRWLERNGVASADVELVGGDALLVRDVPAARVADLFQTRLHVFAKGERTLVRQMGDWSLPSTLAEHVDFVTGVADFPLPHMQVHAKPAASSDPDTVPETLRKLYSIPADAAVTSADASAGVIEYQDLQAYLASDMSEFFKGTATPVTNVTHKVGPFSTPPADESTLDIQYILAMGVGAEAWYWTNSDWLYDFGSDFNAASSVPSVISQSYGWYEGQQCQIDTNECDALGLDSATYVARVNVEFQKMGLRGVSALASSGDSGANGRTDEQCTAPTLRPTFPAGSPYITAVGATQLANPTVASDFKAPVCQTYSCASGGTEVAVSYDVAHFTSGGGFSQMSTQPKYQAKAVAAYLSGGTALPPSTYYNASNRAYPDIAAMGNNFLVRLSGQWSPVGGTSASCPTIAGIVALLNDARAQAGKKPLGFLNPVLYQMFEDEPAAFNDVVTGDNKCTESGCSPSCKGFLAAKGWDPVTGLGTPNFAAMKKYVVEKVN